jgi:hypothetical protein
MTTATAAWQQQVPLQNNLKAQPLEYMYLAKTPWPIVWLRDQQPYVYGLGVSGPGHCWSYELIHLFLV